MLLRRLGLPRDVGYIVSRYLLNSDLFLLAQAYNIDIVPNEKVFIGFVKTNSIQLIKRYHKYITLPIMFVLKETAIKLHRNDLFMKFHREPNKYKSTIYLRDHTTEYIIFAARYNNFEIYKYLTENTELIHQDNIVEVVNNDNIEMFNYVYTRYRQYMFIYFILLDQAIRYGKINIVKYLKAKGMSISDETTIAAQNNQLEVLKYLISMGSTYNITKMQREAKFNNHQDILDYLDEL